MTEKFNPSERHNVGDNVGPDFVGVSGDGGLGRGRTLVRRERPRFYTEEQCDEMTTNHSNVTCLTIPLGRDAGD